MATNKGMKWYTNGIVQKMCKVDCQPDGFCLGKLPYTESAKLKMSKAAKLRGPNNKGKKFSEQAKQNMSIAKKEFLKNNPDYIISNTFQKGNIPWNKGLNKYTDDRVKQSAERYKKTRGKGYHYDKVSRKHKQLKENETRIKNFTFRSSYEKKVYFALLKKYDKEDIIREYIDENRYPFPCDFYIKSEDLFLEVHGHWMHGPHKFNPSDIDDILLLTKWRRKCKYILDKNNNYVKNIYFRAVECWTKIDILKYNTAKKHNLNYLVVYSEELNDFIARF